MWTARSICLVILIAALTTQLARADGFLLLRFALGNI